MTNPIKVKVNYADYDLKLDIQARGITFTPGNPAFMDFQREALEEAMVADLHRILRQVGSDEGLVLLKDRTTFMYDFQKGEATLAVKTATMNRRMTV